MIGSHVVNDSNFELLIAEAKENIDNYEPTKLLHKMVEDYMYFSSQTYYNWFKKNSNLDNLPIVRNPECWEQFSSIDIPILTLSGSKEEDYYIHLDLLKEKATNCTNFEYIVVNDTGHTYKQKEQETGKLIQKWIENNFQG